MDSSPASSDAWRIRIAARHDADAISALARRVFVQTFAGDPDHKPHDLAMYLEQTLGAAQFAADLAAPEKCFYVAHAPHDPGALLAYLRLDAGHAPDCVPASRPLELVRLYVDFDHHRTGLAHEMMRQALEFAEHAGHDAIWLGVWHRNHRAQRFYRKWGFEHVGEHPFTFGTDAQTDLVFARPVHRV